MPAKRMREVSAEQRGLINWSWEEYCKNLRRYREERAINED